MPKWPDDDVILFDGVCIFCSRWVRFVAKRDTAKRFRFTPIQSDYGARLARTFGIDAGDPDTNAVVHGGEVFMKSDAALTVLSLLPGLELGERIVCCAEAAARPDLQPHRAQPLSHLRKVQYLLRARCRFAGAGD
ncbi:putative DCC family thiol-disulfide oxidoreductase YuxK [Bradyrhizobium diazoefficiens]